MRQWANVLLGIVLLLPLGCADTGEEETKSPAQPAAIDVKPAKTAMSPESTAKRVPLAKTENKPKTLATNTETGKSTNTLPNNVTLSPQETELAPSPKEQVAAATEPGKPSEPAAEDGPLPKEFAALSFVPKESFAVLSIRPRAILEHPLITSLPKEFPLEKIVAEFNEETSINLREMERVTVAFWMGEGHWIPGKRTRTRFQRVEPQLEEVPDEKQPAIPENAPPENPLGDPDTCAVQAEEEPEPLFQGEGEGEIGPGGPGFLSLIKLDGVFIFESSKPVDPQQIEEASPFKFDDVQHNGFTYRASESAAFCRPNPTTLLFSPTGDMPIVLDNKTPADIVRSAIESGLDDEVTLLADVQLLRTLLTGPALLFDEQLPGLGKLPQQAERLSARLDLNKGLDLNLTIETNDEAAPKTMETAYNKGYDVAGQFIAIELPGELKNHFGDELGSEIAKMVHQVYTGTEKKIEGKQFQVNLHVPESATELVKKAAEFEAELAKRMAGKNQFKMIGIAIHNFHDTYGKFPFPNGPSDAPATQQDKLSWRVHVLPYLDEYELYEKFKLDEPWDSEHNKALLEQMPDVYKLSRETKAGHTQIVAPSGKGFIAEKSGLRLRDMTDGPSNTLMAVTVVPEKAVPWTKPGGFELDPEKAANVLGGDHEHFLALFGDGRVEALDPKIDAETLNALLTRTGGELVDHSKYVRNIRRDLAVSRSSKTEPTRQDPMPEPEKSNKE